MRNLNPQLAVIETALKSEGPNFDHATKKAVKAAFKTLNARGRMKSAEIAQLNRTLKAARGPDKLRALKEAFKESRKK